MGMSPPILKVPEAAAFGFWVMNESPVMNGSRVGQYFRVAVSVHGLQRDRSAPHEGNVFQHFLRAVQVQSAAVGRVVVAQRQAAIIAQPDGLYVRRPAVELGCDQLLPQRG